MKSATMNINIYVTRTFFGAYPKLRKAAISFVMTIRPSFRLSAWNISAPTGRVFMEFDIWAIF